MGKQRAHNSLLHRTRRHIIAKLTNRELPFIFKHCRLTRNQVNRERERNYFMEMQVVRDIDSLKIDGLTHGIVNTSMLSLGIWILDIVRLMNPTLSVNVNIIMSSHPLPSMKLLFVYYSIYPSDPTIPHHTLLDRSLC